MWSRKLLGLVYFSNLAVRSLGLGHRLDFHVAGMNSLVFSFHHFFKYRFFSETHLTGHSQIWHICHARRIILLSRREELSSP